MDEDGGAPSGEPSGGSNVASAAAGGEEGGEVVIPFSPDELACALRVVEWMTGKPADAVRGKPLRPLRLALAAYVDATERVRYGGATAAEFFSATRTREQQRAAERKQAQLDREHLNKTALRAQRLARITEIASNHSETLGLAVPAVPDGAVEVDAPLAIADGTAAAAASSSPSMQEDGEAGGGVLAVPAPPLRLTVVWRTCYACHAKFQELHHFYATLCPRCAGLNWQKRNQSAPMEGRVALVTGGRVKIGFHVVLKLLRAGAAVVVTTRFPNDAAERLAAQPDFAAWKHRVHVYGIDLRDLAALEAFCDMMVREYPRLDVIINNACQTVRRPPSYFAHLVHKETAPLSALPDAVRPVVERNHALHETLSATARDASGRPKPLLDPEGGGGGGSGAAVVVSATGEGVEVDVNAGKALDSVTAMSHVPATGDLTPASAGAGDAGGVTEIIDVSGSASAGPAAAGRSALMTQLAVVQGDNKHDSKLFPTGATSWRGREGG